MSLVKDNGFSLSGKIGGISGGIKFADNALTCDSEGNCMLKDELIKIGGSFGGVSGSVKFADNALTCDSAGNCMLKDALYKTYNYDCDSKGKCTLLKDDLIKIGGSFGGVSGSVKFADSKDNGNFSVGIGGAKVGFGWADNSLTCDSTGNCMLKDDLWKAKGCIGKLCGSVGSRLVDNLGSASGKIKGEGYGVKGSASGKVKWADNALTCDSEGNCMLKDDLWKAKGCIGKLCAGISNKLADNALTCDSEGNCMLKDDLIKIGGSIGGVSASMKF